MDGPRFDMLTEAATKALLYAAVLQTIGAATAFWVVIPKMTADAERRVGAEQAIRRVGLCASMVVVLALVVRAWSHTATTFGFARSLSSGALWTIVAESQWGRSWQVQMLAALACVVAYTWVGRGGRGVQVMTAITSGATAVALTRTGHAAGVPGRMAIHSAHLFGSGAWLGTLTTLMAVRRSVDQTLRRSVFRAFSGIALTGAAVLVSAGLVASWWYVGSLANMWTTRYGRVLLVKIALVCGVVACGYLNWRGIESGRSEPGRAAMVELVLAVSVIAATGLLTELEHP
jgi:putative copper export protein